MVQKLQCYLKCALSSLASTLSLSSFPPPSSQGDHSTCVAFNALKRQPLVWLVKSIEITYKLLNSSCKVGGYQETKNKIKNNK